MLAVWFSMMNQSTGQCLLALGKSRSLAMSNAANLAVTLVGAMAGFHYFGLEGFIVGYAAGNAAGAVVQDHQLHKLGFHVFRQDLMYTAGALALGAAAVYCRDAINGMTELRYLGELAGLAMAGAVAGAFAPAMKRELWGGRASRG